MHALVAPLLIVSYVCSADPTSANSWSHFRGPSGKGVAVGAGVLPTEISPKEYVVWKTPLPAGHSSPVIVGQRIFLTGVEDKKLYTICVDRQSGKELWRKEAPYKKLEKIHSIGSHAQSTPAADDKHVVSLFGAAGLFCYDHEGKQLWHLPLGPFNTEFGAASSPLLVDGKLILCQDYDQDSFLAAFDVHTGKQLWKTDRAEFPTGYASPILWEVDGKKQIVQAGTLRVVGYDFDTGKELWTVRGLSRICNMTPSIGPDNNLYLAGWAAGSDPDDLIKVPTFQEAAKKHDANKNGTIELSEMPAGPLKDRYPHFDRDRNDRVTKAEWEGMRQIFSTAKNRMIAIKPGGSGEITKTHVLWEQAKQLPYIPSPVLYNNLIFLVKNGGLVSSLDPKTGKSLKYGRIPASGSYYSSPVAGDGKVFLANQRGEVTVISADAEWEVLHTVDFGEDIFATPAILDGNIYLRTAEHLYNFRSK